MKKKKGTKSQNETKKKKEERVTGRRPGEN